MIVYTEYDCMYYRVDVTVVDYTVQRNDDEAVENLNSPKRVDLERSLSTVGKTLYSRAPAPPPEEVRHIFNTVDIHFFIYHLHLP